MRRLLRLLQGAVFNTAIAIGRQRVDVGLSSATDLYGTILENALE